MDTWDVGASAARLDFFVSGLDQYGAVVMDIHYVAGFTPKLPSVLIDNKNDC